MAQANTRLIVGGMIAALFLALYGCVLVWAILYAQGLVDRLPGTDAFYVMNIVGGLVSAVVVAELAITATGSAPGGGTLMASPAAAAATPGPQRLATVYVFVWLALGVAALVFGLMARGRDVPQLMEFAKTWLGLAIAAAYAYFGIKP